MSFTTINGLKTHYMQSGSGPDVLLVHAFTSNLAVWMFTDIIPELTKDFRVTMYDLRGHGASEVPPSGYTSDLLANDLNELHRHLDLGPAWLVGHSYGGVIAIHAAVEFPDIVRGVVLSDTFFPGLSDIEPNMKKAGAWHDLRETLKLANVDIGDEVDFTALFKIIAEFTPDDFAALNEKLGPASVRWLSHTRQLAMTTAGEEAFQAAGLTAERIASVQQPVIAMYDEFSPFMNTCNFLRENLPRCIVDILPKANHLGPVQNSAEFAQRVGVHLRSLTAETTVGAA